MALVTVSLLSPFNVCWSGIDHYWQLLFVLDRPG